MNPDLTPEHVDYLIEQWEEAIRSGQTFLPIQNAPETLDALKELRKLMTGFSPCRACGEMGPTVRGYCTKHQ